MTTSAIPPELKTTQEADRRDLLDRQGPTPLNSGKSKKRGVIWLAFLVIIAGLMVYAVWRAGHPTAAPTSAGPGRGRSGGPGGAGLGPVPVVVAKVARSSIPVYLNGLGNVSAFYTVTVTSRVDGQIMKVDFNEGDLVKQGQVLFELDPRPYQVQLEQAQGVLAHIDQAGNPGARAQIDLGTSTRRHLTKTQSRSSNSMTRSKRCYRTKGR